MNVITVLFLALFTFPCFAKEISILESEKVHVEGNCLFLKGPLTLENELGILKAGKAVLEGSKKNGKFELLHADLEGDVFVSLIKDGDVHCQRAVYANGTVTFSSPLTDDQVMYRSPHSWTLHADTLTLFVDNTEKSDVKKVAAEGAVTIDNNRFTARCKRAVYDQDILTLMKGITIDGGENGVLTASDKMHVKTNDQGELQFIKCLGNTKYRLENEAASMDVKLLADGQILIDHGARKITMHPSGSKQLYCQHGLDHVYADEAVIDYDWDSEGFHVKTAVLNGNVRLATKGGSLIRCVLADHATYHHIGGQFCFKSFQKKRVLFYDKLNHLQVSAPEITMQRDALNKPKIQGLGDVRFHFAEKEFEQLRKRFQLEKKGL